jgi:hypothetical protein
MTEAENRQEQLRIQAMGAALSRRDWGAVEQAYSAIRDAFDRPSPPPSGEPARAEAEPVAWRWKPKNATLWIYNPEAKCWMSIGKTKSISSRFTLPRHFLPS